jgi:hypothetical protein
MNSPLKTSPETRLDLPIAPAWFSEPPAGTMEDGIQLSLAALELVRDRPEIFEEQARQRVDGAFVY